MDVRIARSPTPWMAPTNLSLGGRSVALLPADEEALAWAAHIASHLGAATYGAALDPCARIFLCSGADEHVNLNEPVGEIVFEADGVQIVESPDSLQLRGWGVSAEIDPRARLGTVRISGEISPGEARSGSLAALMLCLCLVVREAGVVPLHAAALAHGSDGLLIPAPSGSGKTTLAIALATHGWAYVSDDAVLLHQAEGEVLTTPFRRTLCVLPETLHAFPNLQGKWAAMTSDSRKSLVNLNAVDHIQTVDSCVATLMIFPRLTGNPTSQLRPLRPSEALLKLLAQSALLHVRPEWTRSHISLLTKLVSQAPAYELAAGVDILEQPSIAASLIEDKLSHPQVSNAA